MSASREKKLRRQEGITGASRQEKTGLNSFQKSVIIVVSVIVVLFAAAVIFLNSGLLEHWSTAVTIGDEKISAAEYNYYYMNTVNSMLSSYESMGYSASSLGLDLNKPFNQQTYSSGSGTWDDQFKSQTNNTLQTTFAYYQEAKKAGYELTQEDRDGVEEQLNELETYCSQNNLTMTSYLRNLYGSGIDKNTVRGYMLRGALADSYKQYLTDELSYTDEQLQQYYDNNKDDIDVVDYRAFSIDGSNKTEHEEGYEYAEGEKEKEEQAALDAAKAKANRALSALTDLDSFAQVARDYCDEKDQDHYKEDDATVYTNAQKSSLVSATADWLFDASRKQGDKAVLESGTNVVVVMFDQRYREEYALRNVRHILLQKDNKQLSQLSDEEKAELKQQAEDLLAQWKAGDATEESFAQLADEKSADSPKGGLYENVYRGQMVESFENWLFDDSRKVGDTGVVETTYGYQVMYYVGEGQTSWRYAAESALTSDAINDKTTEFRDAHPLATQDFGLSMIGD